MVKKTFVATPNRADVRGRARANMKKEGESATLRSRQVQYLSSQGYGVLLKIGRKSHSNVMKQ